MAVKSKARGGRPKQYEQHKAYQYKTKNGKVVKVAAHREKYSRQ